MTEFSIKEIDGKEVGIIVVSFTRNFVVASQWFGVDKDLIPFLERMGNFHVRDVNAPGSKPAFMKRRDGGRVREIRLPHICFSLRESTDPLLLALDWSKMCKACEENRGRIQARPINGLAVDCQIENWVLPLGVLSEEQEMSMKVSRIEPGSKTTPSLVKIENLAEKTEEEIKDYYLRSDWQIKEIINGCLRGLKRPELDLEGNPLAETMLEAAFGSKSKTQAPEQGSSERKAS